ncbi:NAD-dependent DNA ligase [Gibbsiella quercinecans]|uniref:BRCT domain-containing protein n=1 Tax=Gibbsiella quercinecans TaxID=929813 RepID=UPI000EF2107A|nr:BRCT domain-containing protein [Gibbsiella quercinecans]RLM13343.1 NAD-dependent DNA ligase [Gibbsiella quercinecans]
MPDKNFAFSYARNRDKLIANLISIIDGILADGHVNKQELLYLDTWLLEAKIIEENRCIKMLKHRLQSVLVDGEITADELLEIKKLLPKIQKELTDLPSVDLYSSDADMHLLMGLCKGLICDKTLSESEIHYLDWWITKNASLKEDYPGKDLFLLIKKIMQDGKITIEESESLHEAMVLFTGCDLESGVVDGLATRLPVDPVDTVAFVGKRFCLTGTFYAGKRSVISEKIKCAGGIVQDGVNKKLDYLVVGTGSSRDWSYSSHGRKIEKAIAYREEEKVPLKIIGEEKLIGSLPAA